MFEKIIIRLLYRCHFIQTAARPTYLQTRNRDTSLRNSSSALTGTVLAFLYTATTTKYNPCLPLSCIMSCFRQVYWLSRCNFFWRLPSSLSPKHGIMKKLQFYRWFQYSPSSYGICHFKDILQCLTPLLKYSLPRNDYFSNMLMSEVHKWELRKPSKRVFSTTYCLKNFYVFCSVLLTLQRICTRSC